MKYYLAVMILITMIYFFLSMFKFSKKKKFFLIVSFVILFLFSALRSENIGTDLVRYNVHFRTYGASSLSHFDFSILSEYGFIIYNKIIYLLFNGNYRIFIVITSFLTLLGVFHFIYNNSSNYYLSIIAYICLGFFTFTFSGLRQSLAISIILFSFKYLQENKPKRFIFLILLASSFHISALVVLPAYFLSKFNFRNDYLPFYLFLLFFMFFYRYHIISIITRYFYSSYDALTNSGKGYSYFLFLLVIFIYLTIFKKKIILVDKKNNVWYNFFSLSLLFQILATVEGNAHRLTYYYYLPIIVLIPYLNSIFNENDKKSKILFNFIIVVMLFALFIIQSSNRIYKFM